MEVSGKSYGSGTPFKLAMEGYLYANTIINVSAMSYGSYFPAPVKVMNLDGTLAFWWPRGSYWNSFEVHVRVAGGESWNRVTGISDSVDPASATKKISITPIQVLHTNNAGYAYNMNQNVRTDSGPTFANVYTSGWFRNYGVQGMYNESYGTHFYSSTGAAWNITGSGGNIELRFRSNHESTIRGYVYADTSNQIGFLNNGGGWTLRTNSSNNAFVHGVELTINADGASYSNIIMNDGDEGNRVIHCNSNRIGFLTQGGGWGSWCSDDGSWNTAGGLLVAGNTTWFTGSGGQIALENIGDFARFAFNGLDFYDWQYGISMTISGGDVTANNSFRAPIFYDSQDTGYFVDPNSTSNLNTVNAINFRPSNAIYFGGGNNYFNWTNSRIYSNVGIQSASDMLSPIFYDSQDTTYYLDPNSTGTSLNIAGSVSARTYNKPGMLLYSSGTSSSGAALGMQQVTGEGWTGIFVDFEPYTGWGLYHDNPNNFFCITAEDSTNSLRSFTVPSRNSGDRTAYEKIRFDQNNGRITNFAWTTNGRNYSNEWIEFGNYTGLYSPLNGAHFYPNNGTFGSWRVAGSRNGYAGLEFDSSNGPVVLMVNTSSNLTGFHNNSYGWQFRWDNGTLYCHKNTYGGGTAATVLDSSNYSSWAIARSGDAIDNIIYFRTNQGDYLGSLTSAKLQVYNDNNQSAFMSFHRSGQYAVNFGLDRDNVMRIGGWSASANRWELDMSGNNTVAGSFRAPIFYDSENTAYYLDPNGNSVLTTATFTTNGSSTITLTSAGTNASMIKAGAGDELYLGGNDTWQMRFNGGNVLMDNGGYLQNNQSLRAPIFYDSENTAYYLDPAGTSRLGGLMLEANLSTGRGSYGSSTANLILLSEGTYGRATIDFRSGVNYPSDGAQIYYETATNLSSGETSRLVIRTENDADDSILIRGGFIELNTTTVDGGSSSPGVRTQYNGNNRLLTYSDHTAETNSFNAPQFLVNGHSDNTKGYRIHNTSGSSVSAMFTNSSNALVIAAGALDQINLNKKVYVNGVALGVNVTPSSTAGRIDASNDIVAYSSSDERLKYNITPIENAIDKVKSLTGVEFDWKPEYKHAHGYEGHDTGIIAQQVQGVIPSAVRTNDTGFLAVRYEKLIGLLIEANKELAARVEELEKKLG